MRVQALQGLSLSSIGRTPVFDIVNVGSSPTGIKVTGRYYYPSLALIFSTKNPGPSYYKTIHI
jgi:hypothetical protein